MAPLKITFWNGMRRGQGAGEGGGGCKQCHQINEPQTINRIE